MLAQTIFVVIFLAATVLNASCATVIDKTCKEISTFIPNACLHKAFKAKCNQTCLHGNYQSTCGTHSIYSQRKRPIFESDIEQWPWHVSLQWKGGHACGASILSPHFIITSAHCLDAQYTSGNPADFTLFAGTYHHVAHRKNFRVHSFKNHPGYLASQNATKDLYSVFVEDNLSIIRLKDKLELGSGNRDSVCLPDLLKPFNCEYQCFMIGNAMEFLWKQLTLNNHTEKLNHSPIEAIPMGKCNHTKYSNNVLKKTVTVCAGMESMNLSPWDFDSGGGLVCEMDGKWYLYGITASSGFMCGKNNSDAMFTNVVDYEEWIITSIFELQDADPENGYLVPLAIVFIFLFLYISYYSIASIDTPTYVTVDRQHIIGPNQR